MITLFPPRRRYHHETCESLWKSVHTHVELTGVVKLVKHEADGDWHLRLVDGRFFMVAEIIPELPFPRPRVGQTINVYGIRRFDNEAGHGWPEIHPVLGWRRVA